MLVNEQSVKRMAISSLAPSSRKLYREAWRTEYFFRNFLPSSNRKTAMSSTNETKLTQRITIYEHNVLITNVISDDSR